MRSINRVLLILFMIALLPLRGWAGEVMATEMASTQVVRANAETESATGLVAVSDSITWAKATFRSHKPAFEANQTKISAMHDCEGHAVADGAAPADAHCDSCSACQACHTVALSTAGVSLNLTFSSRTLPRPAAADFASAAAALGQKPPIS